jgi:hypothetical protein
MLFFYILKTIFEVSIFNYWEGHNVFVFDFDQVGFFLGVDPQKAILIIFCASIVLKFPNSCLILNTFNFHFNYLKLIQNAKNWPAIIGSYLTRCYHLPKGLYHQTHGINGQTYQSYLFRWKVNDNFINTIIFMSSILYDYIYLSNNYQSIIILF